MPSGSSADLIAAWAARSSGLRTRCSHFVSRVPTPSFGRDRSAEVGDAAEHAIGQRIGVADTEMVQVQVALRQVAERNEPATVGPGGIIGEFEQPSDRSDRDRDVELNGGVPMVADAALIASVMRSRNATNAARCGASVATAVSITSGPSSCATRSSVGSAWSAHSTRSTVEPSGASTGGIVPRCSATRPSTSGWMISMASSDGTEHRSRPTSATASSMLAAVSVTVTTCSIGGRAAAAQR